MTKESDSSFQCAFEKAIEVMTTTDSSDFNGRIECEICKGIFFMQHHFNSHICNEKAKQISCSICQKTFTSRFRLRQHSYLHSGERPVECKVCKKRFSRSYIAKHLQTHTDNKRYKCKICAKSYRYSDTLRAHMYSHTGEKPHKCKYCGRQFRVKSILRVHLTTHEEKTNNCPICPRVFSTKYYLKVHMAIHKNEKPFKCETCGKCFVLKITLKNHMKTHLGKKPFKCDQCSKWFTRKDTLSVHIKCTHDRDTTSLEKCHICDKHYLYKSRLEQHMRTHNKFECLFCFRLSDECVCSENPERHNGDSLKRPFARDKFMFKCQTCFRIILRKSQLKMHMRIHSDYKCIVCNEDYKNCSCSDDYMEVSKGVNTYQKTSKPSINADQSLTKESVEVKEEEIYTLIDEPAVKHEKKSVELNEMIIPKEEPKQEIGENFIESFAHHIG